MSRTSRTLSVAVVATLAIMLGLSVQARQGQTVDPALKKAADARIAAGNTNPDTYRRYTLDDAYIGSPEGVVETVQSRIAAGKGQKPSQLKASDERFRMLGEAAAIHSFRVDGTNGQGQKTAQRRLEVWTKQNGEWKVAAVQVTDVAKP